MCDATLAMSKRPETILLRTYTDADFAPWLALDSARMDRTARVVSHWLWDHVYRLEAHGVDQIPATGGCLLVPNHSSYADPFLLARCQSRHLRFMAKASMFTYPVMRSVMKFGGGFPVHRGKGDTFAMELARRLLDAGRAVVVYPEGTRFREALELGPARSGAARLALEAGVPVIPVATWGVKCRKLYDRPRWRRPRTIIIYGEAMDFSGLEASPENVALVRDQIWSRVHELHEQARELAARPGA